MKRSIVAVGLLILGLGLAGTLGMIKGFPLASVTGVDIKTSLSNLHVADILSNGIPKFTFTVTNLQSTAISYYQIIRVSSADDKGILPCSGTLNPIPLMYVQTTIAGSEVKDYTVDLTSIYYQVARIYEVCLDLWQQNPGGPASCTTDPLGGYCNYTLIAESRSTQFTIQAPTQAQMYVQACYGLLVNTIATCTEVVATGDGLTTPSSGRSSTGVLLPLNYQTGTDVALHAQVVTSTTTFLYWIKNYNSLAFPSTQIQGADITVKAENNAVYTAIFSRMSSTTRTLTVLASPTGYGTTNPAGTSTRTVNEAVHIIATPSANQTVPSILPGSLTTRVFTASSVKICYEVNCTVPQTITIPNDNPLVKGTKGNYAFDVVMDTQTAVTVTVIFTANDLSPPGTSVFPWWLLIGVGAVISAYGYRQKESS